MQNQEISKMKGLFSLRTSQHPKLVLIYLNPFAGVPIFGPLFGAGMNLGTATWNKLDSNVIWKEGYGGN